MKKGYLDFPEEITKVSVRETVTKKGCKVEHLIVNDKWKLTPTDDNEKPFKRRKLPL